MRDRVPTSEIVDTAPNVFSLPSIIENSAYIFDINIISLYLIFKKIDIAFVDYKIEESVWKTCIFTLMKFTGTEDVEKPITDYKIFASLQSLSHISIEKKFRKSILVVRFFILFGDAERFTVAINRTRRCIYERYISLFGKFKPEFTVFIVVLEHNIGIIHQNIGICADMENHFYLLYLFHLRFKILYSFFIVQSIVNFCIQYIFPYS